MVLGRNLYEATVLHHCDPIAKMRDDGKIVADKYIGKAFALA